MTEPPGELIRRAQAGDREAASGLVALYQTPVRTYAALVAPAPDMAEDIAQDVFIECVKSIGTFDPSCDFGHWLKGIARNVARGHWRRLCRERTAVRDALAEYVERMADSMDLRPTETRERLARLRSCVDRLPPKSGKILSMHYFAHLKCSAIGSQLGTSVAAVKMALVRIRRMVRDCVEGSTEVARG